MNEATIAAAKKLADQFRAFIEVSDALSAVGGLNAELNSARRAAKSVQDEIAVLKGNKDAALADMHEGHRKVLAERGALQAECIELQAKNAEAVKRLRDLERQCEAVGGQLLDLKSKLNALKAGIAA